MPKAGRVCFPISVAHMILSSAPPSLADRLVRACWDGDLPSAKAAVADGASVNKEGRTAGWIGPWLPLVSAARRQHLDVVVWLLSHGADANGDRVMWHGGCNGTDAILQLLVDAGGDVNRSSGWGPPLFPAVYGDGSEDKVRVLLAQPSLEFTTTYQGKTPEQYALDNRRPAAADMIAQEVSGEGASRFFLGIGADGVWRCCG